MKKETVLNPREVLAYLNEMGIRNVSGDNLKEFMTDLKRLMRSELSRDLEENDIETIRESASSNQMAKGPERLYSCSTYSSRSKCTNKEKSRKPFSCLQNSTESVTALNRKETPADNIKATSKEQTCSCQKTNTPRPRSKPKALNCRPKSANFIRIPITENKKKSDPVSLYHYYSSLWEKYKSSIPGEDSRSDIRWSVRQKILGSKEPQTSVKGSQTSLPQRKKKLD